MKSRFLPQSKWGKKRLIGTWKQKVEQCDNGFPPSRSPTEGTVPCRRERPTSGPTHHLYLPIASSPRQSIQSSYSTILKQHTVCKHETPPPPPHRHTHTHTHKQIHANMDAGIMPSYSLAFWTYLYLCLGSVMELLDNPDWRCRGSVFSERRSCCRDVTVRPTMCAPPPPPPISISALTTWLPPASLFPRDHILGI